MVAVENRLLREHRTRWCPSLNAATAWAPANAGENAICGHFHQLQCRHGVGAVENETDWLLATFGDGLQCRHGVVTVENRPDHGLHWP